MSGVAERTVEVESRTDDNGVKSTSHERVRSALWDLSSRETPTHTVVLPHGTKVKMSPPLQASMSSYRPHFSVDGGGDVQAAVGVEEAANLARSVDTLKMPKAQQKKMAGGSLSEAEEEKDDDGDTKKLDAMPLKALMAEVKTAKGPRLAELKKELASRRSNERIAERMESGSIFACRR